MNTAAKIIYPSPKEMEDLVSKNRKNIGESNSGTAKEDLLKEVGHVADHVQIPGPKILVAVYYRPEKTQGGILDPTARKGDSHQGKVGLILRMGPLAFVEDENHKWGDVKPKVGDWVQFRVGDTAPWRLGRDDNGAYLRYVEDVNILAIWDRPDLVW